jgi:hypothetical protein
MKSACGDRDAGGKLTIVMNGDIVQHNVWVVKKLSFRRKNRHSVVRLAERWYNAPV